MAGSFPRFRLYDTDGTTLIYEFENVLDWGDSPFQDPGKFVIHTSLRGQGGIVAEGSTVDIWDLQLEFYLSASDYEALVALINAIPTTITKNTKYILKIDLTSSTTKDLKVKRLGSFRFPINGTSNKATGSQRVFITFTVNSWD